MLGARSSLLVAAAVCGLASVSPAQATLSGSVLNDPGERPIPNAEIVIRDANKTARSDTAGNFRITGIAAGDHSVMVRLAGYEPWIGSITFVDGKTVEADFMMKPVVAKLDTVQVKARPTLYATRLRDFEERRKQGIGHFITTDVFEKNVGRRTAEILLGSIPGIKMIGKTDEKVVNSTRDGRALCPVQVVLNDNIIYNGQPGQPTFDINSLNPEDVLGVEYYSASTAPIRFQGTGASTPHGNPQGPACGTLIVWTK